MEENNLLSDAHFINRVELERVSLLRAGYLLVSVLFGHA